MSNHAGDAFFSSPDIYVQVQRRDAEILRLIRGEENRIAVLGERQSSLDEEMEPLRVKKRDSEREPGEPLSPTRIRRLADLFNKLRDSCNELSEQNACNRCDSFDERPLCSKCEDCREMRLLQKKKAESEIIPGPPLTPIEKCRLRELKQSREWILREMAETSMELTRLRDEITSKTNTVTTSGFTLDYGFGAVQEVFLNDMVWIAVYDEDDDDDDLYGSTTLRISENLVNGGIKELSIPNVELLTMRILSH